MTTNETLRQRNVSGFPPIKESRESRLKIRDFMVGGGGIGERKAQKRIIIIMCLNVYRRKRTIERGGKRGRVKREGEEREKREREIKM